MRFLTARNRLHRRTTNVRHKQKKWYRFVKERQEEEDANQEKEVVQIRREALLFKRYAKELEVRRQRNQRREDKKRQDAFLDAAYEERKRQDGEVWEDSCEEWDPIEEIMKGEREDLVDLMHRLLWLEKAQLPGEPVAQGQDLDQTAQNAAMPGSKEELPPPTSADKENVDPKADGENTVALSKNARKRAKAKAKAKAAADSPKEETNKQDGSPKIEINETREDMRARLLRGITADEHKGRVVSSINDSEGELFDWPGIPESEVDGFLDGVAEIKELLLCRLILSQSNLLPIALRTHSLTEFFADAELNLADLRNLCLRYEQPKLQEIRDACADFARGDGEESDDDDDDEDDEQTAHELAVQEKYKNDSWRRRHVGAVHRTKHEEDVDKKFRERHQLPSGVEKGTVDFGLIDEEGKFENRKVRVRLCGKSIWNYPSEKALARGGWYHFSIIAKNNRFNDAVSLCRNWAEFWELSNLVIFNYFSSTTWYGQWAAQPVREQQLQMGIISYLDFNRADQMTVRRQGGRRPLGGKPPPGVQFKNVTAFCIKRNDPISRRFVQYLSMESRNVCMNVRDAKTGRVLVEPPTEHKWLMRVQGGLGPDDWIEKLHVGDDETYELLENSRSATWQFGFNDYYDITAWDLEPGMHCSILWSTIQEVSASI